MRARGLAGHGRATRVGVGPILPPQPTPATLRAGSEKWKAAFLIPYGRVAGGLVRQEALLRTGPLVLPRVYVLIRVRIIASSGPSSAVLVSELSSPTNGARGIPVPALRAGIERTSTCACVALEVFLVRATARATATRIARA